MTHHLRQRTILQACFFASLLSSSLSGAAKIVQKGPNTIVIHQKSGKVIIEWQNFDIGPGDIATPLPRGDQARRDRRRRRQT